MAIKNSFVISKQISLFLSFLALASCATLEGLDLRPAQPKVSPSQNSIPVQEDQKDAQLQQLDAKQVLGRNEQKVFRPKLALILGPGLARTFAHVGILKKLIEADIPIQAVFGMGWGSLIAYEYSSEGAVHGLEWRLSRSKEFEALTKTTLWSSEVKPKTKEQAKALVRSLTPTQNNKGPVFGCSLMSGTAKKIRLGGKSSLADCISVPPLLDSGSGSAPYLMDVRLATQYFKSRGVEKVLFINVLGGSSVKWGEFQSKIRRSEQWYWNFVENTLLGQKDVVDHIFNISTSKFSMLDFDKSLSIIRKGYAEADQVVEFLQSEYQF